MKNFKSHFKFNKQERSGIFFLLLLIVLLQIGYFIFKSFSANKSTTIFSEDSELQAEINLLKKEASRKDSVKIYPFNPNFITDYKGYTLGMSVEEIDRLQNFRAENKYVNSSEDFQKVTLVSDSLLQVLSSYFKFPEWTKKSTQYSVKSKQYAQRRGNSPPLEGLGEDLSDINAVTAKDLILINGIGEILSARIIKFRDRLGGFLINEQLFDVYGLEQEVAQRVLAKFKVLNKPNIKRININTASAYEISSLVYIKYNLAKSIVEYREVNGDFSTFNELTNITDFPSDRIDRIALYLSL